MEKRHVKKTKDLHIILLKILPYLPFLDVSIFQQDLALSFVSD